ncbi:hypothetical protein WJX72_009423 [[Myrmecia] bisecta]|uniref:Deubiquitinating enzyme MINDY-3/4 conserved domain-containing protein n=1 Tax=[Myrmecia] bisecta TaxID=41462 RepID=A0AAW1Q4Z9_9CHLO
MICADRPKVQSLALVHCQRPGRPPLHTFSLVPQDRLQLPANVAFCCLEWFPCYPPCACSGPSSRATIVFFRSAPPEQWRALPGRTKLKLCYEVNAQLKAAPGESITARTLDPVFSIVDCITSGQYMQAGGYGLLLLLFSVVLSHSVRQIQAVMGEPENTLIAQHGYCSPDLVHLLLTGRAAANCFNGDRELDGKVYRGIPARSQLGLLTLFEHYKCVEVGSHLKSPHLPIWVVCSDSHFTTRFAPSAWDGRLASVDWRAPAALDMVFDV